jgi:hypothetical protein
MMNMDPRSSAYYPYVLTGGQKLKHLCSTIIFLDKPAKKDAKIYSAEAQDMSGSNIAVGSLIRAKVTKSRRVVEGRTAEFYWNLETGEYEQKELELVRLAKALGVLYFPPGKAKLHFGPITGSSGYEKEWVNMLKDKSLYTKVLAACNDTKILNASSEAVNAETVDEED